MSRGFHFGKVQRRHWTSVSRTQFWLRSTEWEARRSREEGESCVVSECAAQSHIQIHLENCDRDRDIVKLFYFRDRID